MDLKSLDTKILANEGVWIDIVDPATGTPSGLRWKIAGLDSDRYADFQKRAKSNGLLKRAIQGDDDKYDYDADMLAELTLSWEDTLEKALPSGTIIYDGEKLPFSKNAACKVLQEIPVVKRQVSRQVLKEQNFLSVRSKSSSRPSDQS